MLLSLMSAFQLLSHSPEIFVNGFTYTNIQVQPPTKRYHNLMKGTMGSCVSFRSMSALESSCKNEESILVNVHQHNIPRVEEQVHVPKMMASSTFTEEDMTSNASMSRFSFLSKSSATILAVATADAQPKTANAASNPSSSSSTSAGTSASTTLQETISGFVSGAAITTTKTFVKYPLDTATVRLQMPNTSYSISNPFQLLEGSYRGIALPLLFNIPGGAIFFAVKDATKALLKQNEFTNGWPKWIITCVAVAAAQPPYWLVRNPSEVVKTRQQANIEGYVTTGGNNNEKTQVVSPIDAIRLAMNDDQGDSNSKSISAKGVKNLYTGYWENIFYAYPADVIKFVAYEALASKRGGKKNLPPLEGAVYGAMATAVAQFVTTPLDVVRNRIMADTDKASGISVGRSSANNQGDEKSVKKSSYLEKFVVLAKEEGLEGLFAGATPRIGKAFLSGAIQFATYESVQQSFREYFSSKIR